MRYDIQGWRWRSQGHVVHPTGPQVEKVSETPKLVGRLPILLKPKMVIRTSNLGGIRYQLPWPAIKACEFGLMHAVIPCRPHPVAIQLSKFLRVWWVTVTDTCRWSSVVQNSAMLLTQLNSVQPLSAKRPVGCSFCDRYARKRLFRLIFYTRSCYFSRYGCSLEPCYYIYNMLA